MSLIEIPIFFAKYCNKFVDLGRPNIGLIIFDISPLIIVGSIDGIAAIGPVSIGINSSYFNLIAPVTLKGRSNHRLKFPLPYPLVFKIILQSSGFWEILILIK
ncbi:hypothetical protein M9Y10_038490 [Tritrichomonas musculus]|uniref:Uncharacterized protein n=1 Tax=Tritrichomonas musculus TaxID=1915356 RepID=A0ABR2K8K1_9EUKA